MSEIAALVADNLDIWTGAIERKSGAGRGGGKRISLYGIDRLRALILDLAVRGKLVPQDAGDEPASELLKMVAADRKALITQGKISKPKALPKVWLDEISVPDAWATARFGNIFSLEYGDNLPEPKRSGTGEYSVYGSNGVVGTHHSYRIEQPCVVVGRKGSAGALNVSTEPCWVTDVAYYCIPPAGVDLRFQFILFHTLGLDVLGKGIKPGLNRNEANVLPVGLPPLAEQQRIVAKVDELMALCDALERESAGAMVAHQTLVEILLATLVNSADATDLARDWARLESHFDTLFTTDASIDALKQTILDLAVRGKLTSSTIEKHMRVGQIFNLIDGDRGQNYPKSEDYLTDGYCLYLSTKNVRKNGFLFNELQYISQKKHLELRQGTLNRGDLIITTRGTLGNIAFFDDQVDHSVIRINSGMLILRPISEEVFQNFMMIFVQSPSFGEQMRSKRSGSAQPQIPAGILKTFVVPVFKKREQHRIVAKVDTLMALCDALKARLADAAQTQRHLADAITQRAAA